MSLAEMFIVVPVAAVLGVGFAVTLWLRRTKQDKRRPWLDLCLPTVLNALLATALFVGYYLAPTDWT